MSACSLSKRSTYGTAVWGVLFTLSLAIAPAAWSQGRGISLAPQTTRAPGIPHSVASKTTEAAEGFACNIIDFEGIQDYATIGTVQGELDVTFGPSWLAIKDVDAGGEDGNFANEPSPSTIAFFLDPADPITFERGVQFVELFYTASAASIPVKLTAWSGPNGTGQEISDAIGRTVGLSLDGAPCQGDPNGTYCLWSAITLISDASDIRSITLSGAVPNQFAFDDMTFCESPPLDVEVGQETSQRAASFGPREPTVIYNPEGGKAVIWQELHTVGTRICIQLFDANDNAITPIMKINGTDGLNTSPTGSFGEEGLFVTWRNETGSLVTTPDGRQLMVKVDSSSVFGRFFGPTGDPATGELPISSGGAEGSNDPAAATSLNGDTVLTWEDGGDIVGQLFDPNGNPIGATIVVGDTPGAKKPVTGASASGDFVTVWQQASGNKTGILARRFRDNGTPKGASIVVDSNLNASAPDVAVDHDGNFIVVYEKDGSSGRDIFARLYTRSGAPRGSAFQVNALAEGDQTAPDVDTNASGDFFVVWESSVTGTRGASDPSVFGRFFGPEGDPPRVEVVVTETEQGKPPKKPKVSLDDDDDVTVVYEREGPGGESEGIFRKEVSITESPEPCVPGAQTLCLSGSRFRVTANWEDHSGNDGQGQRVVLTTDTGYFWFFNSANVELIVKVLDACPINSNFWVFAAGLTNVEVNLRVEDTVSGVSNTYFSPAGTAFQPIQDTSAFATCDAGGRARSPGLPAETSARLAGAVMNELQAMAASPLVDLAALGPADLPAAADSALVERGNCPPSSTSLCLNNGRFLVLADWATEDDDGDGRAVSLTSDTGYFWFFTSNNVEIIVKVLNACGAPFNRYWVFAAGLTDVEVQLTVIDTVGGAFRVYENDLHHAFAPIQDTNAFATCP